MLLLLLLYYLNYNSVYSLVYLIIHRRQKLLARVGRGPPTFLPLWAASVGPIWTANFWVLSVQLKLDSLSVKCVFIFYYVAMRCFINVAKHHSFNKYNYVCCWNGSSNRLLTHFPPLSHPFPFSGPPNQSQLRFKIRGVGRYEPTHGSPANGFWVCKLPI